MEILCFCHLRWDFVYQRPQHLLSRFGQRGRVHLWEEPRFENVEAAQLATSIKSEGVTVVTPILPHGMHGQAAVFIQRDLLNSFIEEQGIKDFVAWYYTPMALTFSDHLQPRVTVYDCMDELSAFQGAPPDLMQFERKLFERANVVFAGGTSLYLSKRNQHGNVHLFPSSIDHQHFATAREEHEDAADQAAIPHPRIGFYGVLDERLDCELLREISAAHPEWHLVLIGPVVKIREDELPKAPNLHYLGQKSYNELPSYLAGWDVAMLPFARNASTRFISPTKTPEYLAGGKPVVSTPIRDVVHPYAELKLVRIGENAEEFAEAIRLSLLEDAGERMQQVDGFLAGNSWDKTFEGMWKEIQRFTTQGSASSAINAAHD